MFSVPDQRIVRNLYALLGLGVVAYFAWFIYGRALNMPYHDDILDIVKFVLAMHDAESLSDSLAAVFAQYNDHRTGASRLVYYALYLAEGELNFRTITFVANLALPLLATLYALSLEGEAKQQRIWVLVLGLLMLCHPRAYGLVLWAMSSFAFYYVCVYAFITLYLLHRTGVGYFVASLATATACSFTLASGQMIWVFGAISLGWQIMVPGNRSRVVLPVWIITGIAVLALYRFQFSSPNTISAMLTYLWQTPCHHIGYFLAIIGSGFSFDNLPVALGLGVVLVAFYLWVTGRDFLDGNLTSMHFFTAFMLGAVFVIALGRAPYSNLDYALVDRYSFASLNLLLCVVVLGLNRGLVLPVRLQPALLVIALTFNTASYRFYTPLMDENRDLRIEQYSRGMYWVFGHKFHDTASIVRRAIELDIYRPPELPSSS